MKDLKYINQFTDRCGNVRTYFRRPGQRAINLPNDFDSTAFKRAYEAALSRTSDKTHRLTKVQQHLLELRNRPNQKTGVYLLLLRGEVVYVGTSANMAKRVAAHRANGRQFDQAFFIYTRLDYERFGLERALLRAIGLDRRDSEAENM